ncbi:MAG: carboxypeptidase-like regulatory domain-containing protein [Tannerellaceae bacterium]|jgi:protocatechuate 3,4-dioxygenase beta subunit|nr:carboxypeptidase-like regulatory domain-containing protein [Tannerellaceae bacterium]
MMQTKVFFRLMAVMAATLMMAFSSSCNKTEEPGVDTGTEKEADFLSFTFEGIDGNASIDKTAHSIAAKAMATVDLSSVAAEFSLSTGATATVNGLAQISRQTLNDFRAPVVYKVRSGDGATTNDWTVKLEGGKVEPEPKPPVEVVMQDVTLAGTVRDAEGRPLAGVSVSTGGLSVSTGSDGTFSFGKAATVDNRAIVRFEKSGYFGLTRSGVKESEMELDVVMRLKGNGNASSQASFGATESKTLSVGAMQAVIPAAALVTADGSAYTGTVRADMLYLDPNDADFAEAMPGGDLAAVRSNSSTAQLLSYGMTEIALTDNAGNPLQLKPGASSELSFPIPAGMENDPPATIPLWYFDEERGLWVEEGRATLQGNVYKGSVSHFSWHNLDVPAERVTIKGKVTDCENLPVPYVKVSVEQTAAVTNSRGEYSVFVPAGTPVSVTVKSKDYDGYSPEVSHNVPGRPGGSTVTQDIKLPCRTQAPGDGSLFAIDKASVTYIVGADEMIITFDNKGKRMRWDSNYGKADHGVIIFDEQAKLYTIGASGFWMDFPYEGNSAGVLFAGFIYDDAVYSQIPGYAALPNETIAGKSCKVFSYTEEGCTYKVGTWNGLLMLVEGCDGVTMVATSVSLNVPANAFTKTMNIF